MTPNFRLYLQEELVRRCKANPQYSLRAFARTLGVESSRLSKMIKGQRPMRKPMIEKIGMRLGLSLDQLQQYTLDTNAAPAQLESGAPAQSSSDSKHEYRQLSLDAFELISDWRHYAIMELSKVQGFKPEAKWIAQRLGTTASVVHACLERLQRVGILKIEGKKWIDESKGFRTHVLGDNITSHAHRLAQEELLKLAILALRERPIEERDQSSMMMATSRERLQEAKQRIKRFRRELCEYMESAPDKDTVMQLSVSLFPLA